VISVVHFSEKAGEARRRRIERTDRGPSRGQAAPAHWQSSIWKQLSLATGRPAQQKINYNCARFCSSILKWTSLRQWVGDWHLWSRRGWLSVAAAWTERVATFRLLLGRGL